MNQPSEKSPWGIPGRLYPSIPCWLSWELPQVVLLCRTMGQTLVLQSWSPAVDQRFEDGEKPCPILHPFCPPNSPEWEGAEPFTVGGGSGMKTHSWLHWAPDCCSPRNVSECWAAWESEAPGRNMGAKVCTCSHPDTGKLLAVGCRLATKLQRTDEKTVGFVLLRSSPKVVGINWRAKLQNSSQEALDTGREILLLSL